VRDQLARREPDVSVRPPDGSGCLLCGLGVQSVSALAMRMAAPAQPLGLCTPATAVRTSLGGMRTDRERVEGHLCRACARAVDDSGGAVGQQAIARALLAHVEARWSVRAQRLRMMLPEDQPPTLPGWAADTSRLPSTEPWGHPRRFIESVGRAVGG
jgi:hypothetical protein